MSSNLPVGILLGNLGTPRSPSTADVRSYLREFLMDPYVIDKPFWVRWILVNLIIAPFRAPKSAHAYQSVWMKDGSPLAVYSERLKEKLQVKLGVPYKVTLGMRYGEPSIRSALEELKGCEKILLAPQYPEFAQSSYQTWLDVALDEVKSLGLSEKIKILPPFFADEDYLAAQHQIIEQSIKEKGVEHLLFSFHGLPESHLRIDGHNCLTGRCVETITAENKQCYRAESYFVARELAKKLGLGEKQWSVSFQSRLGPEPWIAPFTDVVIPKLAKDIMNMAVAMPAFTCDCLETLEEIGMVAKEQFLASGGKEFIAVPCMNDNPYWVERLATMVKKYI
jgi:protoporphyrin/coproporphyrin ferrochelatase